MTIFYRWFNRNHEQLFVNSFSAVCWCAGFCFHFFCIAFCCVKKHRHGHTVCATASYIASTHLTSNAYRLALKTIKKIKNSLKNATHSNRITISIFQTLGRSSRRGLKRHWITLDSLFYSENKPKEKRILQSRLKTHFECHTQKSANTHTYTYSILTHVYNAIWLSLTTTDWTNSWHVQSLNLFIFCFFFHHW